MSAVSASHSRRGEAEGDAAAAAAAAGVTVRPLTDLADLERVVTLFDEVWGASASPPISLELMRALTKAGNYVGGAHRDGRLVGACVGFFHAPGEGALHSHIAGVAPAAAGRQVGYALKLHQRAWALDHGVEQISWTFDPLVARNAWFNLAKLGGVAAEYLPDFYGVMGDRINAGVESDRLLVRWRLDAPLGGPAVSARAEEAAGAVRVLAAGEDGEPVRRAASSPTVLVGVPADIEALRAADPALAARWRAALRETLQQLLADGGRVVGFDREGTYVVRTEL
jgi:predicted GNAT superfamily acetyltransferase